MRWARTSFEAPRLRSLRFLLGIVGGHGCTCTVQQIACFFTHVSCQCAEFGAHLRRRSSFLFGRFCSSACCSRKKNQERVARECLPNIYYDPLLGHNDRVCSNFVFCWSKVVLSRSCMNPNVSLESLVSTRRTCPCVLFLDVRRSNQHFRVPPWQLGILSRVSNLSMGIRIDVKRLRFTSLVVTFRMHFISWVFPNGFDLIFCFETFASSRFRHDK